MRFVTTATLLMMMMGLPAAAPLASQTQEITVIAKEFRFDPGTIVLKKGERVSVIFENRGALSHNFTVPGLDVRTDTIQGGKSAKVRFTVEKAGTYTFLCTVSGHEQAGMKGTLTVN